MGWSACSSSHHSNSDDIGSSSSFTKNCESVCEQMVQKQIPEKCKTKRLLDETTPGKSKRFSSKLSHWAAGLISINRKDLFETFDFGVPMDPGAESQDVLVLYNDQKALPNNESISRLAEDNGEIPQTTATGATENCDTMSVVFIKNPKKFDPRENVRQCVALVGGQYQGYHVQRWMRLIGEGSHGKLDRNAPLRVTSRMTTGSGYDEFILPTKKNSETHQQIMLRYFQSLPKIKNELGSILKKIAVKNTVVVMTVNKGQSELLMNFACSARARGFQLDNVIVFPTDSFSKDIAEGLGLATYYSHEVCATARSCCLTQTLSSPLLTFIFYSFVPLQQYS